jgi:hypothetical protein
VLVCWVVVGCCGGGEGAVDCSYHLHSLADTLPDGIKSKTDVIETNLKPRGPDNAKVNGIRG